jgi:hypothetical protein
MDEVWISATYLCKCKCKKEIFLLSKASRPSLGDTERVTNKKHFAAKTLVKGISKGFIF